MKRLISLLSILAGLMLNTALSQSTSYTINGNSQITVAGTSTVHDWIVEINKIQSDLALVSRGNKIAISNTSIEIRVDDMKSGKSRMDRLMHDALKKDKHPEISFRLDPAQTVIDESMNVKAVGSIKIAGVERPVSVDLEGKKIGSNEIHFTGSKSLKMSDYDVDPPTAMLGTIRAGNEITLNFDLYYSPDK